MAPKWLRYNRGNCPVCQGASKECRGFERDDGRLQVHCRGKVFAPMGWGFIGDDAHGFAKFVEGWGDRTERDWAAIERAKSDRLAREAEARRKLTTADQRDRVYRALLPNQRLAQRHRAELHRRGLNDQQIALAESQGWLKTWVKGTAAYHAPDNIPGLVMGWEGIAKTGINEGLAIAAPDIDGRLVLHQVRPDVLPADGGKYRYLASGNGEIDGEMPLPVFQHPDRPLDRCPRLWITEAYLKPLITALQAWDAGYLDVIVIGYGGCNWASSPNQLRAIVDQFNPCEITILPDAGWANPPKRIPGQPKKERSDVATQIIKLLELLPEARVADWGQWRSAKADKLDPDEVPTDRLLAAPRRIVTKADLNPKRPTPVGFKPAPKAKPIAPKDGAIVLYHSDVAAIARGAMPLPSTPVSWFPQGDRLDKWEIASSCAVLDASAPGTGKTYDAGRYMTADRPGQTIYIANNHRNPDDDRLRHLPDLPSKHGGLVSETKDDRGRLTPYLRRPRAGEKPTEQGSCYHADSFDAAAGAGLILGTGKSSPLCQQCPWGRIKKTQNEDGSESIDITCDYLEQRAKVLEAPAYRAHIDSIPLDTIGPETTFVIEEASTVIRGTKTCTINANQIAQTEHQLRSVNPDLAAGLAPVFIAIQRAIGEAMVEAQGDRWHGMEHEAFMGLMPNRLELEAKIPSSIVADWLAIDPWADGRSLLDWTAATVSKSLAPDLKDLIDRHDPKGTSDRFRKSLRPRLLESLLKTIAGSNKHVYRVGTTVADNGELTGAITITSRDHRHRQILSKGCRVILLDGTAHPHDIQRAIRRPVVTIAQQLPCYRNLTIKHVTGMGRLGAQRRTEGDVTQMSRLIAALKAIKTQALGRVAALDYLRYVTLYEPLGILAGGHFTGDGRGSNRFAGASDMVLACKPVQNLGALHDRYMAETGKRFTLKHAPGEFWAWANRLGYAETKQEADRLRSQLGDQPKTLWLLGNQFAGDIERLKADYPGATFETIDVMDIAPEGASKGRQTARDVISTVIEAAKAVATTGGKLTQAAIAQAVGCSVAAVSNAVKTYAGKGFKDLVKTLVLLFSSHNNKTEVFEPSPEVMELANRLRQLAIDLLDGTIAPDDAREAIAQSFIESGETVTEQAIAALPARERRALRAIVDRSSLVEWLQAQIAIYGRARVMGNRAIEKLDDRELAAIAVNRHW